MEIKMLDNEFWWCANVSYGEDMPFDNKTTLTVRTGPEAERGNDQFMPMLLSSKGRYVYSENPIIAEFNCGTINFKSKSEITLCDGFENLKGAYLAAMKAHFPFTGKMPDDLFFTAPQYNTWIELGTNQTQEGVLDYARGIIENGMKPGVLMIDGGWQEEYGTYDFFHARRFPDPKTMVAQLKAMGFRVMVWVSPIVASAGTRYKQLRDRGFLVLNADGTMAVRKWWSGYSAVLDFTNPEAVAWLDSCFKKLQDEYGIDGFKFDAGDEYFYLDDDKIHTPMSALDHTAAFNLAGEKYPFNEYRAAYKTGGRALVARLHDKRHEWKNYGLNTLIPHTIMQGLCGYAYCCPDMVGGGEIQSFYPTSNVDEELFVRWAQANALMGMMQISAAPWRVLSKENSEIVKNAINLHAQYGEYFLSLGQHAAKTGEPVVRHMAYVFPDEDFEKITDQFMLGDDVLVAPVLNKGQFSRDVVLPHGKWVSDRGEEFEGGRIVREDVPIDRLVYYKKV